MADAAQPAAPGGEAQAQRLVGSWALGAHIGAGSFAIVWRARHVETGAEAAVKEINLSRLNAKLRQSLESEVAILQRIRHPNIVRLHEVVEAADRLYLIMEFCAGGDLAHLLRRAKRLPEAGARHLMRQLAAGLRQMWSHHLVHRDLKPQNLLLSAPSPDATLKIADFGFARNLQPQGLAETLCGSPLYMAPEILHFHKYDAKADLWSCGTILYEMVVGRPPFTGANQFQLLRNIERSDARVPDAIAAQLSPHCRHLIHCLLRRNPVERLSFEEFFRHPFVATPEEAAAPLPPRAPLGAAPPGAALQPAGQAGQAAGRPSQRLLLFSTSAPAVAAAAGAVQKSRSSGSIPQQVLGFQEAQQPGRLGTALGGGAGTGAAVPVGGLSNQLKPRSLDLDGPSNAAAALAQQAQQQAGGAQQQRRPQPVAGHRLSIQRVQGFQPPAAPAPGQPQQQQQQGWPAAQRTPFGSAGTSAPGVRPGAPRPQQGLSPAAALAAAGGVGTGPRSASMHSEDDDYVMVDGVHSAHTAAAGRGGSAASLPAAASPQRSRPPSQPERASLADSRNTSGSAEEDIFTLGHAGTDALGGAGAQAPSWLDCPRWRLLQHVALALQAAAGARQAASASPAPQQALRETLSLHLAALQLLEQALEAAAAPAAAEAVPEADGSAGGGSEAAEAAVVAAAAQLQHEAASSMAAAEAAAEALGKAGREPSPTTVTPAAAAAAAEAEGALPDPWDLLYASALAWGREAAVDELLGNQERSALLYARAGAALSFLAAEAAGLALEPPLELAPPDRARLARYAAATAVRWAACACAPAAGSAGGDAA